MSIKSIAIFLISAFSNGIFAQTSKQAAAAVNPFIKDTLTSLAILSLEKGISCNTSQADFCLILKNPVFANKAPLGYGLVFGMDLDDLQTIPIVVTRKDSHPENIFESRLAKVYTRTQTGPLLTVKSTEGLRTLYRNDPDHVLAQATSFYVFRDQVQKMQNWGGGYFINTNRFKNGDMKLLLNAYDESVENNATYNSSEDVVKMGYKTTWNPELKQNLKSEMALSSEIVAHELGHANFQHATGRKLHTLADFQNVQHRFVYLHCLNGKDSKGTCKSVDEIGVTNVTSEITSRTDYMLFDLGCRNVGCIRGMDEGQADLHALIQFQDTKSTTTGETFFNSLEGVKSRDPNQSRGVTITAFQLAEGKTLFTKVLASAKEINQNNNSIRIRNLINNSISTTDTILATLGENHPTKKAVYNAFFGERHSAGSFYSSVLWEIYKTAGFSRNDFAKLFVNHLPLFTNTSTYKTMFINLVALDRTLFPSTAGSKLGRHEEKMRSIFSNRGVPIP